MNFTQEQINECFNFLSFDQTKPVNVQINSRRYSRELISQAVEQFTGEIPKIKEYFFPIPSFVISMG